MLDPETPPNTGVVKTLADAYVGATVYLWDQEARNPAGGRGLWKTAVIDATTRYSLIIRDTLYDRKTGQARPQRGYSIYQCLAGVDERRERETLADRWKIAAAVQQCSDAAVVAECARLLGVKIGGGSI